MTRARTSREERIRDLEATLATVDDTERRIETLNEIAAVLATTDAAAARDYAREALELATTAGDEMGRANAHQALGHAFWILGEFSEALEQCAAALRVYERRGETQAAARTHMLFGSIYLRQHRIDRASEATLKALRLSEESGDRQGEAIAHNALGVLLYETGDSERALEHRLRSAEIHEQIGDHYRLAMAHINIGNMHFHSKCYDRARSYYDRAIAILEKQEPSGHPIAIAYHNLADLYKETGDHERARSYVERAIEIRERTGDTSGAVSSGIFLAELERLAGEHSAAERRLQECLSRARQLGVPKVEWEATNALSQVYEDTLQFERALKLHKRGCEIHSEVLSSEHNRRAAELQARFEAEREERDAEIHELKYVQLKREVELRRSAEQALARAQRLESLGLLAGGVAHDFNNALMCVLGCTELLKDATQDPRDLGLISLAEQSALAASELVQQLLAYAGGKRFDVERCRVEDVLGEYESLLTDVAGLARLRLAVRGPLPAVCAEPARLGQLLTNLVLNAVEAGASSIDIDARPFLLEGREPRFSEHTQRELAPGDYVCIRVTDDGDGVESDTIGRVFDPFFTTKERSRGLGLTAVLGIVRCHGGGIAIASERRSCTEVEVLLPRF